MPPAFGFSPYSYLKATKDGRLGHCQNRIFCFCFPIMYKNHKWRCSTNTPCWTVLLILAWAVTGGIRSRWTLLAYIMIIPFGKLFNRISWESLVSRLRLDTFVTDSDACSVGNVFNTAVRTNNELTLTLYTFSSITISGFSAGMEILLRLLLSGISHPCALMTAPSERLSSDVRAGRVVHVFLKFYYQKIHSVHIFIQNFFFWHFFCHPTNSLLKHSHLGGVWLRGCCEMNTHEYTQMTPFNHWRVKNDLDSHRIFLSLRRTYHSGCCQVVWGEMGHFSKVGSGCVPNYILVLGFFFTFSTSESNMSRKNM